MGIRETATGKDVHIIIEPLEEADLKKITKHRYFFDWKVIYNKGQVFKLCLAKNKDIKGLMAIIDHPEEQRIEVTLLAVSRENVILKNQKVKRNKEYDKIAGNLLAYACKVALLKYGAMACVSLTPKTVLKKHYMEEYGMADAGMNVFFELAPLHQMITKYKL